MEKKVYETPLLAVVMLPELGNIITASGDIEGTEIDASWLFGGN